MKKIIVAFALSIGALFLSLTAFADPALTYHCIGKDASGLSLAFDVVSIQIGSPPRRDYDIKYIQINEFKFYGICRSCDFGPDTKRTVHDGIERF